MPISLAATATGPQDYDIVVQARLLQLLLVVKHLLLLPTIRPQLNDAGKCQGVLWMTKAGRL